MSVKASVQETRSPESPFEPTLGRVGDLEDLLSLEWLETNGLGDYACGTVADAHTRKYHGLLVCDPTGSQGRHVLLSKLEATVVLDGEEVPLATNRFPGSIHPQGWRLIQGYSDDLYPVTTWQVGNQLLRRSILMPQGEKCVLIRFDLIGGTRRPLLHLEPLVAFRSFHALSHENLSLRGRAFVEGRRIKLSPYEGMPDLWLQPDSGAEFFHGPHWRNRYEYDRERERGFDFREDLFCPGMIEKRLTPGKPFIVRAGLTPSGAGNLKVWTREEDRRRAEQAVYSHDPEPLSILKRRAGQFLARREGKDPVVVAGYPWFEPWGRDAMIAVPGLCFYAGRMEEGLGVLRTFAGHIRNGLIPNFLSPHGDHGYNSVDASLWFFWAIGEYLKVEGDYQKAAKLFLKPMEEILRSWIEGQAPRIHVTDRSLVWAGDASTQLTWMDAVAYGAPVTPRHGLAVEVNALWIHALTLYNRIRQTAGKKEDAEISARVEQARLAFHETFWLKDALYLADVVNDSGMDRALRPNQIVAVSLPIEVLSQKEKAYVMENVRYDLATPYGLRTLAPHHPAYRPHYAGNPDERDSAYHQGTVWPWWVGHYTEARLEAAFDRVPTAAELSQLFHGLFHSHIQEYGIQSIAEVFDGDPPHRPGGCIAQAWSVAESIRAIEMLRKVLSR